MGFCKSSSSGGRPLAPSFPLRVYLNLELSVNRLFWAWDNSQDLVTLKNPCTMGYYFIQKLKPDWKDVFTPLAEDMKVLLTP